MIIRDKWKAPTSQKVYQSTGKELPAYPAFGGKEEAYWILVGKIEDILGPEGGTTMEIYRNITGPMGLSSSDTVVLVKGAKNMGYLR